MTASVIFVKVLTRFSVLYEFGHIVSEKFIMYPYLGRQILQNWLFNVKTFLWVKERCDFDNWVCMNKETQLWLNSLKRDKISPSTLHSNYCNFMSSAAHEDWYGEPGQRHQNKIFGPGIFASSTYINNMSDGTVPGGSYMYDSLFSETDKCASSSNCVIALRSIRAFSRNV